MGYIKYASIVGVFLARLMTVLPFRVARTAADRHQ
jgi:hypothetical protein